MKEVRIKHTGINAQLRMHMYLAVLYINDREVSHNYEVFGGRKDRSFALDNEAVGRVVRSAWMDRVFTEHVAVKIVFV